MSVAGRIEARITVPSGVSVSASNSGGGATSVSLTAADYYWTAAGSLSGLAAHFQSQLNSTRAATDTSNAWTVALSTGSSGDGRLTIDCIASGDRLVENSGAGWDSGATSTTTLTGDGYVQFVATATGKYRALGFSASGTASVNFATIAHGIILRGGGTPTQFAVIETGTDRVTGTYASGDVFKIVRTGTVITYYQNGTLIYTSLVAATGNRVVDSAFFDAGCTLDGIRFFDNGVRTALTWSTTGVTQSATTWSLTWTSTALRDLCGFTADISSVSAPQTGTKQVRFLWRPECPLIADQPTAMAPLVTDLRTTRGPTGVVYGLTGNSCYEHTNLTWMYVPKENVREAIATYANASWEQFYKDTQVGQGHAWGGVSLPVQVYDNAGTLLGSDLNSGAGADGWCITGVDKIKPERSVQDWDARWKLVIPSLVSSG